MVTFEYNQYFFKPNAKCEEQFYKKKSQGNDNLGVYHQSLAASQRKLKDDV